jgi:hypothetical protein
MPEPATLVAEPEISVADMPIRRRIIHIALEELRLSNNGTPTQEQMNKYLLATSLYPLNRDGTWPAMAVRYLWNGWCGLYALYCLREARIPDLNWGRNRIPARGREAGREEWGIHGPRARIAFAKGNGEFELVSGGGTVFARTGDAAICGRHAGSHHILIWMPKMEGGKVLGYHYITGNGEPDGRLPQAIGKDGRIVPPLYQKDGVNRVLKGFICKGYANVEKIGAIYSLDLDGL